MGGSGVVELYPVDRAQTQNDFDNRMTHECGHNYHEKFWQGNPEEMQRWQTAADADAVRPSPYAARNTGEDFCEFLILYNTTQRDELRGNRAENLSEPLEQDAFVRVALIRSELPAPEVDHAQLIYERTDAVPS